MVIHIMKRFFVPMLVMLIMVILSGCSKEPYPSGKNDSNKNMENDKKSMIVGEDIKEDDICEFYYTIENINYDAYYLRYLFRVEDGKHIFFFEERERIDDYGPTTEDDTKAKAEFELTDDEWSWFYGIIKGGEVKAREDNTETGGRGPWTYLYWSGDEEKFQEYSFKDQNSRKEFETFCESLVEKGSPEKRTENEQARRNDKAGEAFEDFVLHEFTQISSMEESFVTKRDDDGIYFTEYPPELFGLADHFIGDCDGDGQDELLILQLSGDDIYENLRLMICEYDQDRVVIKDSYEYGENILESDDGNTFVFLYEQEGKPVIGIMSVDSYYTRADGVGLDFKALSYDGTGIKELGSGEYHGSDMEDNGFTDSLNGCGIPISWIDLIDEAAKVRDTVVYSCDGELLLNVITQTDNVEYDEEGYIPERIHRHVKVRGYSDGLQ